MRLPSFVVLFVLSIFLVSAKAQNPSLAAATSAPTVAKPKLPASKVQGLLFEISHPTATKSGKKTYLFASIHIAKADFYPLSAPALKAYRRSKIVAVEADITNEETNKTVVSQLSYVAPDKLQNHLSPATWDLLQSMTGAAVEQFQTYKPIMVAMGLTVSAGMQLGFDPAKGLDLYFIRASQKDKKQLVELESVAFQAEVLGSLDDDEGNAVLSSTLNSFRQGEVSLQLNRIAAAWKAGDSEGLGRILIDAGNKDEGSKKLMTRLMDERNAGLAEKIVGLINQDKGLFAVLGAGHLAGENNLIDLLKKQGLQVKQIR